MDNLTEHFIVEKALAELREIKEQLVLLGDRLQQYSEAICDANKTASQKQQPPPEVRAELSIPESVEGARRAYQDKQYRLQKWLTIGTWCAFIAAAIYAGVATLQWSEMKKATQQGVANADRNFRRDERAWVGFKFSEGKLTLTLGKSFFVPTQFVNTGKTPAKNVHGSIRVGVVKRGEPLDFSYAPGRAHYEIFAGTIFPTGAISESFEAIQHGPLKGESIILTKPMLDDIFAGNSIIVVHGKIIYSDIFGTEHWTTYCRYVLHPEIISHECMNYNNTDDNK